MINFSSFARSIDRLHGQLLNEESARYDARLTGAASMLSLVQCGVEFDPRHVDRMIGQLATVAETYNLSPDQMQHLLLSHEPSLLGHDEEV